MRLNVLEFPKLGKYFQEKFRKKTLFTIEEILGEIYERSGEIVVTHLTHKFL